jgi:membrane dipeptidase
MRWFDLHCDYLSKRYRIQSPRFDQSLPFDVDYPKIVASRVVVQSYALFVSRTIKDDRWQHLLRQVGCYQAMCTALGLKTVRIRSDLNAVANNKDLFGAMLTLEGVMDLPNQIDDVHLLFEKGVRAITLTWNEANWAADGVWTTDGVGITNQGRALIQKCEQLGIALDASHLSENAFWKLVDYAEKPFYCSHSNSKSIWAHPRNLSDNQIRVQIERGGIIGITAVPMFLNTDELSSPHDLIKNIYRICELGGENQIAFGSDFDGIDQHVRGLEHTGQLLSFYEQLRQEFSQRLLEKFTFSNAARYFSDILPIG